MKRKPIKIDWDELESAFDSKQEDLIYYLDLVTGHMTRLRVYLLDRSETLREGGRSQLGRP